VKHVVFLTTLLVLLRLLRRMIETVTIMAEMIWEDAWRAARENLIIHTVLWFTMFR
jgi:hypothetical protein